MPTVGIIANPAAGKDIRRLVAQGRVVSNQEKSNILRRVFAGLQSHGVSKVIVMPDMAGLARNAMSDTRDTMQSEFIDQNPTGNQRDSTIAARIMRDAGADCIVTLGGDGTNRLVAKGCGEVPMAPISTGTNNVFPKEIEGTLAGIAAATIANDPATRARVCRRSKKIDITVDDELRDIALVDAAVSRQTMVGARSALGCRNVANSVPHPRRGFCYRYCLHRREARIDRYRRSTRAPHSLSGPRSIRDDFPRRTNRPRHGPRSADRWVADNQSG